MCLSGDILEMDVFKVHCHHVELLFKCLLLYPQLHVYPHPHSTSDDVMFIIDLL